VDESHLTGEADDVSKDPAAAPSLLGGSRVLSGAGRMLVTAVGRRSQSGAIAEMVARGSGGPAAAPAAALEAGGGAGAGLREETLLQRKLAEYAATIGRFGLGAAALATAAMAARFRWGVRPRLPRSCLLLAACVSSDPVCLACCAAAAVWRLSSWRGSPGTGPTCRITCASSSPGSPSW
jgi:magnesium-transporting ATPase (P-type)